MRLPLDLHPKYWRQLRKELREMPNKSVLLDMVCTSLDETDLSNEPVGPTTRHGSKQLKELHVLQAEASAPDTTSTFFSEEESFRAISYSNY